MHSYSSVQPTCTPSTIDEYRLASTFERWDKVGAVMDSGRSRDYEGRLPCGRLWWLNQFFFDPCHLLVPIPFPMPLWTLEKHSEFSTPAPVTPLRSRWYIEREGRGRCRCVGTTRMPVSFVSLICSHLYYVYSFGQVICLLYVTKLSILVRRITASDEATCSPLNLPQISKFIEKERKKKLQD